MELDPTLAEPPLRRPRLRAIQGSRFVVGMALFVVHLLFYAMVAGMHRTTTVDDVIQLGRSGVTYFFALSGFVLTYAGARTLREPNGRMLLRFWAARVSSLWPIHLIGLGVMLPVYAREIGRRPLAGISALFAHGVLLQAWVPFHVGTGLLTLAFNTPSWSLSALIGFYLVLPGIIWFGATVVRASPRVWLGAAVVLWGATFTAAWAFHGDAAADWAFHYFPLLRFSEFFGGTALAMALAGSGAVLAARGHGARRGVGTAVELGVLAVWVATALTASEAPASVRFATWSLPTMLLVIWTLARERGMVSRALASRPMQALGELTLCFSMLHFPIVYASWYLGLFDDIGLLDTGIVAFSLALAVSIVAHRWIELPARRAIRRRADAWIDAHLPLPAASDDAITHAA
ncbi:MAG: Acyltransferase family protein [Thermoleophilia bacterium]|nr:Acyltransferase family protein [Thermoleophilia bacterium]